MIKLKIKSSEWNDKTVYRFYALYNGRWQRVMTQAQFSTFTEAEDWYNSNENKNWELVR